AHHPYPVALQERAHDVGADGDTADFLNLAPRHGLPVCDKGKCLEKSPGVAGRPLFPQLLQAVRHRSLDLCTEAGCNLRDCQAARFVIFLEAADRFPDLRLFRRRIAVEQILQLVEGKRLSGRQQGCFHEVLDLVLVHDASLLGWRELQDDQATPSSETSLTEEAARTCNGANASACATSMAASR